MDSIDISKLDKAAVLAALYNAARPQGMGYLHYEPQEMTREQAELFLLAQTNFDYLKGRVMKINLKGDLLYAGLYDRDNGEGAAQRALERAGLLVNRAA